MNFMNKLFHVAFLLMIFSATGQPLFAQVKCYRISFDTPKTDWRDTSCVACTSDPAIIAEVNNQLSKHISAREKHINGAIAGGNALVNKNGPHNFLWHFKLNEWTLADFSMEVCDGRPHSDIDLDTTYWLNTVGRFCPWGSRIAEETEATNIRDITGGYMDIAIYPNPASEYISLVSAVSINGQLQIYDMTGRLVLQQAVILPANGTIVTDVHTLTPGIYMLTIHDGRHTMQQRISMIR